MLERMTARARAARITCLLLLGTGCLAPLAAAAGGASEVVQLLQQMAETEDIAARHATVETILTLSPPTFAGAFCQGYLALELKQDIQADRYLDLAIEERPNFALGPILFGDLCRMQDRLDRAERYYRRAIEIQPERNDARLSLGEVLLDRAEVDPTRLPAALEAFRQMTEENPASPDGWVHMADVLVRMERWADAEMILGKAIERDPKSPNLLHNLGALHARQGHDERAEEAFLRALALSPGYGAAAIDLSALYGREGRLGDALQVLEKARRAVVAAPWGPRVRHNLGFLYLAIGDLERAGAAFLEGMGQGHDALSALGAAHLRFLSGDPAGALDPLEIGAAEDTSLAQPFVAAWSKEIRPLLTEERQPVTRRILALLGSRAGHGPQGSAATPALVGFVLEGWNLAGAEALRAALIESGGPSVEVEVAARPIKQVPAEYPESAQERGIEGSVFVLVAIDEAGHVTDARVQDRTGNAELEEPALAAARKWEFEPATRYGKPVPSTLTIPFRFSRQR